MLVLTRSPNCGALPDSALKAVDTKVAEANNTWCLALHKRLPKLTTFCTCQDKHFHLTLNECRSLTLLRGGANVTEVSLHFHGVDEPSLIFLRKTSRLDDHPGYYFHDTCLMLFIATHGSQDPTREVYLIMFTKS